MSLFDTEVTQLISQHTEEKDVNGNYAYNLTFFKRDFVWLCVKYREFPEKTYIQDVLTHLFRGNVEEVNMSNLVKDIQDQIYNNLQKWSRYSLKPRSTQTFYKDYDTIEQYFDEALDSDYIPMSSSCSSSESEFS